MGRGEVHNVSVSREDPLGFAPTPVAVLRMVVSTVLLWESGCITLNRTRPVVTERAGLRSPGLRHGSPCRRPHATQDAQYGNNDTPSRTR